MKKPKKPKPPKPKKLPQLSTPQPPRPQHLIQDRPKLVKRISEHPLMLLAGMIATLAVLVGIAYDALRPPEISADPVVDSSRPFAFPFSVKNESWIFDMRNTELSCYIDEMQFRNHLTIRNGTVLDSTRATIEPREVGLFKCSLDTQEGAEAAAKE